MIEKIIEYSVNNRFIILLATMLIVLIGAYNVYNTPLDAIPDLSDVQVILFTEYSGQAPQVVEDQVTYPLTTAMLSVPFAKAVRGYSFFGLSFVYIIFEDGTDLYWARSRVLEQLNVVSKRLPEGAIPSLGPDATGVGWIYEYVLQSDKHNLQELRSIQDWFLRYELMSVDGVSEVASIGGYVKQYQVEVDPNKLLAYNIPLSKIRHAIQRSNNDVGGSVIEMAETEFMVRGLGYIKGIEDIENIPLGVSENGTPILISNVANVHIGPELRRGLAELNGEGEVVGGIVIMRFGENALATINRVKQKLKDLQSGLPDGVTIKPVYDRSGLILNAIAFLKEKLIEETIVVALVCIIFLLHLRSAFVAIITLPIGILIAFIIMGQQGLNANIMSLGGIAIAIGAMIDAAIVMIENVHKHIERDEGKDRWQLIIDASKEVGPPLFYSLLIITVSFVPVFTLTGQSGRLFKPLAFTKTYAMAGAALLSITLVPVMMGYLIRGKILPEYKNPVNRFLLFLYRPLINFALKYKKTVVLISILLVFVTVLPYSQLGSEFMPPLNEGDILYMPTTLPGISISKAKELLQQTNKLIKTFPEVETVFGKIGRAETATDPAPLSMIETIITLKPKEEWREGLTLDDLISEMNDAIQFPGLTNAWTMPIKTRIDMLSTGIKTPVGIKIMGNDLNVLNDIGQEIEAVVRNIPGTLTVYAERVVGGNYLDYIIDRKEAARYGLTIGDIQDVIMTAVGGMNVTYTIEGLARYPVNIRYGRELRDDIQKLEKIFIATPSGAQIPIKQVASIVISKGPPVIKSENSRRTAWVYIDLQGIDVGTYVSNAKDVLNREIDLPEGYNIVWSGQYEYMQAANAKLKLLIPLTLVIIFLLLFFNFKNVFEASIVMLLVIFLAPIGGIWFIYFLGYEFSVAIWVGFIALAGVAAETGVIMFIYLDMSYKEWKKDGRLNTVKDLVDCVYEGAALRLRPKIMTVTAIIAGLLPIMWGSGTGSQAMKRIAAPMVGGMISSTLLTLLLIPAIYVIWKSFSLEKEKEQN
ncbi:MAG: efflux RND transporter permease subunit [Candidatus Marinimicrobia bacterium]|nr:efflux RND transporter permease subunit [Candidatus Neomarinimicrobiota bacterium]